MTTENKWTNWRWYKDIILSGLKWIIAVYIMVVGALTPFLAGVEDVTRLGWVYNSKLSLTILGIAIFMCGLWLFIGKIRKNRKQVGQGLMAIFCAFVFASALNSVALNTFDYSNLIGAAVMGALYLRWRFTTAYIDPNHFREVNEELRYDEHHRLPPGER